MYHYVRPETNLPPDYYYLDLDDFRRQLDFFEEEFGFVGRESFLDTIHGRRDSLPEGVVLTFDDGLRDHYEFVFPELRERNLWGIFYVPTGPYENGELLDVHRIHLLLSRTSGARLLEVVRDIIDEDMVPHRRREEFRKQTYRTHDDAVATKETKRILNYYVADEYQTQVLDQIGARIDMESVSVSDYYIGFDELREMHEYGMTIGAHTVTHPVLSKLDNREQESEIVDSFSYLDGVVDTLDNRTFCYPYGHDSSFNETTEALLESNGCEWCFKVEPAEITDQDITENPQALPRFDCNEFAHGAVSGTIGPGSD